MRSLWPTAFLFLGACLASGPGVAGPTGLESDAAVALDSDTDASPVTTQDAATGGDGNLPDGVVPQLFPSLDAPPECGEAQWLSPSRLQHRLVLDDFCELFAGLALCPASREEVVKAQLATCSEGTFPALRRDCGLDELVIQSQLATTTWRFDAGTGALVGARLLVHEPGQACPRGVYVAGSEPGPCGAAAQRCDLCESGAERDAACPPEIVALAPSLTCEASAGPSSCACASDGPFSELPVAGDPCDPQGCDDCYQGTCFAECTCTIEGIGRWRRLCTE